MNCAHPPRLKTAAGAQHHADIFRQSLVHPQQIAAHRRVVVAGGETDGPTVLAVPGMRVLVRQQLVDAAAVAQIVVDEGALARAIIARLMMLDALEGDLIAQGPQKMVFVVVGGAEQRGGFLHQLAKLRRGGRRTSRAPRRYRPPRCRYTAGVPPNSTVLK